MTFNWGHGIALFYGIFAFSLLTVVIKTTQYDHSLVTEKYYEKDLQYQEHYEKLANTQQLDQPLKVWKDKEAKALSIQFPDGFEHIKGDVTFYRPVNQEEDFSLPFELSGNNLLEYDTKDLHPGLWTIKIDWQSGNTPYYQEVNISI
jgi:nitrogen fixation protein FixH